MRCKDTAMQEAEKKPLWDALKEAKSHAIDKSKVRMDFKKETIDALVGPILL